jgi:hypothetical protein
MEGKFSWADQTSVHPLGLAALVVLALLQLALPRRRALLPLILMACLMSPRQRIVVASIDFTFLRILVIAGWARVLARGETRALGANLLDRAIPALVILTGVASVIRTRSGAALIYHLGLSFDAIGMYFLFRMLVRDWRDLWRAVDTFAWVAVPVLLAFAFEHQTRRNLFHVFGAPEITLIREGKLRCQGPFPHPIVAGCFWVSLIPLFVASWWRPGGRVTAVVGNGAALGIAFLTASSTPLAGIAFGLVGAAFYPLRSRMKDVRRGLVVVLLLLQLAMDKPIYHLISRIDIVGGSTGWQRYNLIDKAVRRIGEWALIGTNSTAHWGHALQDLTNQYIVAGVRGGLLALILFIYVIVLGYRYVGVMRRAAEGSRATSYAAWAVGVSLFCHTMMFLSVSYFGQIILVWYLLLASIASLSRLPRTEARRVPAPAAGPVPAAPSPAPTAPAAEGTPREASLGARLRRRPSPNP